MTFNWIITSSFRIEQIGKYVFKLMMRNRGDYSRALTEQWVLYTVTLVRVTSWRATLLVNATLEDRSKEILSHIAITIEKPLNRHTVSMARVRWPKVALLSNKISIFHLLSNC